MTKKSNTPSATNWLFIGLAIVLVACGIFYAKQSKASEFPTHDNMVAAVAIESGAQVIDMPTIDESPEPESTPTQEVAEEGASCHVTVPDNTEIGWFESAGNALKEAGCGVVTWFSDVKIPIFSSDGDTKE